MITKHLRVLVIATHPVQYQVPIFRELGKVGFEVKVVFGSKIGAEVYHDPEFDQKLCWDVPLLSGYDHEFLPCSAETGHMGTHKIASKGLISAVLRFKPSVVILFACATPFWIKALIAARLSGAQVILRAELIERLFGVGPRNLVKRLFYDIYFNLTHTLLVYGKVAWENYRSILSSNDKLHWSPYSIDTERFNISQESKRRKRASARADLGISNNCFVILYSGKLSEIKNPRIIFDALNLLSQHEKENIAIIIMGDGRLRDSLASLAEKQSRKTLFLGFVNQSKVIDYHCASNLLILPSKRETWGLVINESLQVGNPVICSNTVGASADLVLPNISGWIFQEGEVNDLANCIRSAVKIWEKGDWGRLENNCRELAGRYSVENAVIGIRQAVEIDRGTKI